MKEEYANNICIIGKKINEIMKKLDLVEDKNIKKIENKWNISSYEINGNEQIENVFKKIIENIKSIEEDYSIEKFSYTIIYSLDKLNGNNNQENNIKTLLNKISSEIKTTYYQPFIIFLAEDKKDKKKIYSLLNSESIINLNIDKRNIECFISPLNEDLEEKEKNIKLIKRKIYKIFSYFFELGDEFKYNDKIYKLYEETKEKIYPINILLLGKEQVGKSTFINTLLREKRAKEGGVGSSETKEQKSYHIDNLPLILNDIEGFSVDETINNVVKKISSMQDKLVEKELHLAIYIINYDSNTFFSENEYEIFKQLSKKLDTTQFLFICSKSKSQNNKENKEKIKNIKKSFFRMINNGLKKEKKENILNVFNYLYICQKKDIKYEEINDNNRKNITKEEFNKLNIYEKAEIKFKGYLEKDKNNEMINRIIDENNNLIFINLKKDNEHNEIFGMDKVSKKIREALNNIKNDNITFLDKQCKSNEEKKKKVESDIKRYSSRLIEVNKEIADYINDDKINLYKQNDYNETKSLLDESKDELKKIDEYNNNFINLQTAIKSKNFLEAQEHANKLKEQFIKLLEKDLLKNKIGAWFSGVIPFLDILIQSYIKKDAKEKIRIKFDDNLKDFDENNIKEDEKDSIKEIKEKVNDIPSDVLKTIGRAMTIGINVVGKVFSKALGLLGIAIGVVTGGLVMNYDINAYLDFYGKRFLYRCLLNLSFDPIEEYLKESFEKEENTIQ